MKKVECPRCKSLHIQKSGFRKLRNSGNKIQKYVCVDCKHEFCIYHNFINKNNFCKMCGEYIKNRGTQAKYCNDCIKIRRRKIHNKNQKKYEEKNKENVKQIRKKCYNNALKKNRIICSKCGKLKIHQAYGLCPLCYNKWYRLNKKLGSMSDFEKESYLRSRGLLEDSKDFSVDDLKKDLGFVNEG